MSESNVKELPIMERITRLKQGETVTQIIPFGVNSLACLTTLGRVLTPAEGFGEWVVLPTPTPYSE